MPAKRSLVHPTLKTKYRVANWADYDRSLVERGNITLWLSPDAIATWKRQAHPLPRRAAHSARSH